MSSFQKIVLDYLEHYRPDTYEVLRQSRGLLGYVETLAEDLYTEADRLSSALSRENPGVPYGIIRTQAEAMAIENVLPLESNEGEGR